MIDFDFEDEQDEDELDDAAYLLDLAKRLRHIPVMYGVDGGDVDRLAWISAEMKGE